MAAILRDSAEAVLRIKEDTQWDTAPELTSAEITRLLNRYVIATVWAASTTYKIGAVIVPTYSNGRLYQSITIGQAAADGVTGATEPTWYRYGIPNTGPIGGVTIDGTVYWRDIGPEPVALWDLRAAAYAGWMQKGR